MTAASQIFRVRVPALMLAAIVSVGLAGCGSLFGEDDAPVSAGSPFTQALASDYNAVAASFGELPDIDDGGWFSFGGTENPLVPLRNAFSAKSALAERGQDVEPENAPDTTAAGLRARLVGLLGQTRDNFPEDAARAQVQYDCWVLNGMMASQRDASAQCRTGLENALAKLDADLRPAPAPVAAAPIAPVAAPLPDYTVYFDFDSWTLTGEALTTITAAVESARTGRQSHINIVGHTDTSGSTRYNQGLSVRRANVVTEAMVQMGARRDAITVSGVGESDLAVATGDGVREAKNRRAVITLQP